LGEKGVCGDMRIGRRVEVSALLVEVEGTLEAAVLALVVLIGGTIV
jgi:hypothetical protein